MIEAFTIDGNGISVKTYREIRKNVAAAFSDTFGDSLATDPGTPDGALIDLLAYALWEIAQGIQTVGSDLDPATAEGVFLDRLAEIAGLSRNTGEPDAELRARMQSATFDGLATFDGMLTYLRQKLDDGGIQLSEDLETHTVGVLVPETDGGFSDDRKDEIAQAIWNCKPAGISTEGKYSGTAKDAAGMAHTVYFGGIAGTSMSLDITIGEYAEEKLPSDWDTLVKDSLVKWAKGEYVPGKDIIIQRLYAPIYAACEGIGNVTVEATFEGTTKMEGIIPVGPGECARLETKDIALRLGA